MSFIEILVDIAIMYPQYNFKTIKMYLYALDTLTPSRSH